MCVCVQRCNYTLTVPCSTMMGRRRARLQSKQNSKPGVIHSSRITATLRQSQSTGWELQKGQFQDGSGMQPI